MEDPLDMRDELDTESIDDGETGPTLNAGRSDRHLEDKEDLPFSLFSDREEEPMEGDSADDPIDTLMKSGQPRLSLVRGDDELDDDGGLIELAPADPAPAESAIDVDTWPWLAEGDPASSESDDESPLVKSLESQFDADLAAPTACGARPTSLEGSRRPMPSLPRPGEIASVAQRVGAQFAGESRIHRTPEVPALLTSIPKTFTSAPPVKLSGDRPITSTAVAGVSASSLSTPTASIAIAPVSDAAPAVLPEIPAARVTSAPPPQATPRKTPDTPKRIGDGKLVQSRLTWKPGDPFAEGARSSGMPGRFRWELMLSTACGTAVFGLAFFWIMRMVF